ncbi:MAG: DNA (cytosine-5-)-methyltransferase [Pseudohaliea sp.]
MNKAVTINEFKALAERLGIPRAQLAEKLGKSARTLRRWETGESPAPRVAVDLMRRMLQDLTLPISEPSFTFIDLFAGIGGIRAGFEAVGGNCVFTSEWNERSRQTYLANFDCDHGIEGDITKVPVEAIPEHDVLLAGFPCQPFSIAGVSKKNSLGRFHGFLCEAQGTLFFDVARIIDAHRPAAFLLENVKNLVNHDKGNTFRVIRKTLEEDLGYHIDWRVINGRSFVPQGRERIFIAGFRKDTGFSFDGLKLPDIETGPRMSAVLHPEDGSEEAEHPYTTGARARVSDKYTLSPKLWSYLQGYAEKHRSKGNGFGFGLVGPDDVARTLSARYYKDGSEILVRQKRKRPRRLTPRECARLMGFDRPGRPRFEIPVSDTQAYMQFGNAVIVPVVESVAAYMLPHIHDAMRANLGQRELALEIPQGLSVG